MPSFDRKTVLVREYFRVRYGQPEVVSTHLRRRRNWRRYLRA
jgi:hypothetical protein